MDALTSQQAVIGESVQQMISNYKKDPKDRKTSREYFATRLNKIREAENNLKRNHDEILAVAGTDRSHEYFKKDYFVKIASRIQTYAKEFEQYLMSYDAASKNSAHTSNHSNNTNTNNIGIIRKQAALMNAIERQCLTIKNDNINHPRPVYQDKLRCLEEIWKDVRNLNLAMWKVCENLMDLGCDDNKFIILENLVQDTTTTLSTKAHQQQTETNIASHNPTNVTSINSVQMPKITIPKFSGDYSEWQQFHDLFLDMIHGQNIPNSQKMLYLVTSVEGQPKNLIKHLSITNDNYQLAWDLITNRYSNKL